MTIIMNKALLDHPKLEPLDETNYKQWSQKLLVFFEQLEVDYMLFNDLAWEKNSSETTVESIDGGDKDKTKTIDDETKKNFNKVTKQSREIC